jgi:putative MATE family efflux protein
MLASAMQTFVRWADIKMVGDIGVEAVAGVAAGGQIYWMIQAATMALTTGLVALVARAMGSNDPRLANDTLKQTLIMGTAFGLFAWVVMLPLRSSALGILGIEETVIGFGSDYLFWLIAANVPFAITFIFAAALRAAGDSRTPLYLGLGANAINIFFNWVLIYGNLGAPALGVQGAGMASGIAMIAQMIIFFILWSRRSLIVKPETLRIRFDPALMKRILKIGYPATIEAAFFQVGILSFMGLMSLYGTSTFTAYQIGVQILAAAFLPGHGFAMAAATVVGQHLGAGNPLLAARSGWRSTGMAIAFMAGLGAVLILFAEPFARWFVDDDEVVRLTVDFIWILGIAQPLMAIEFTMGGALRGAGDTRYPMFVIFTGLFLFRVLPAMILVHFFEAPIQLVWAVLLLDYIVKASLLAWRFRGGKWKTIEV